MNNLSRLARESALAVTAEHFATRMIQHMLAGAMPFYWLRRANDFARVGTAECDEIAEACRERAEFFTRYPHPAIAEMHDDIAAIIAGADAEAVAA